MSQFGDRFGADDLEKVDPVFRSIVSRVWANGVEDLDLLNRLSPLERAVYATRTLEGQLENGGWYQVFFNGVDHLIEPAIEGYELLGLADYAALLRQVRAVRFGQDSADELGESLDKAYFRLSGAERARAAALEAGASR